MFKVEVNKVQLDHIFACLANLDALVTTTIHKNLPEQCAREFASLLKTNIAGSSKYAGEFAALGSWKKNESNPGSFWLWTGQAMSEVSPKMIDPDTWFAGWGAGKSTLGASTVARGTKVAKKVKTENKLVSKYTAGSHRLVALYDKGVFSVPAGMDKKVVRDRILSLKKGIAEEKAAFKAEKASRRGDHEGKSVSVSQGPKSAPYRSVSIAEYKADQAKTLKRKQAEHDAATGGGLGHEVRKHVDTQRN